MHFLKEKSKVIIILAVVELIVLVCAILNLFGKDSVYEYDTADMIVTCGTVLEDGSVYVDGTQGAYGEVVRYKLDSMRAGVYRVELKYETNTNMRNRCTVVDESIKHKNLLTNGSGLYSGLANTQFDMWIKTQADQLSVVVNYDGEGSLTVKELAIYETNAMSRIYLFFAVVTCLLVNVVYCVVRYSKVHPFSQKTINISAGLVAIILCGSYPLMTDVILGGGDTVFHLMRIEGIKDALLNGQFPARIAPEWQHGHGYAASIFYGETLLYVQAFFRMIGFTILTSYRMFQFLLMTATVLVSYYCFRKMFKEPYIGLLCSALYSLSVYRIYKTYMVGAYGEASAILFLPLIAYGFYKVFTDDISAKEYKRSWIPLTVGFTGLVQSHMLSGELTGFFTIILCLILVKKVLRKETFIVLAKTVIYTCMISAWFILPFADYMLTGDFLIQHVSGRTIQERGLYLSHLFKTFMGQGGEVFFDEAGMLDSDPQTVGISLLFGLGVWFWLCLSGKKNLLTKEDWGTGKIAALFAVLAMMFSLAAFPWNNIHFLNELTATLISSLEFPHRFLTIGVLALTVLTGIVAKCLIALQNCQSEPIEKKPYFAVYCLIAMFLLTISSVYLLNAAMDEQGTYRIYNSEGMGFGYVSSGEYLPYGTDAGQLLYGSYVAEDNLQVDSYEKSGLSAKISCQNNSQREAFLQLPILYYKGYVAYDIETGEKLQVYDGNNHLVSVAVPAGYDGNMKVAFVSPWYWRVAECISLATFGVFLLYMWRNKRKA